jgi:transmembrane sensor
MAEVHRLPDWDQAERQASEWIARLNADNVSDDDLAHFESWRTSHQLNARVYDELAATWRAFTAAGPLVRAVSFGQSMNEATSVRPPQRRKMMIAAAATTMIMVAIGRWYMVQFAPETMFQTAVGEHATISLPDHSTLELNTNSLVRLDYSARTRVVRLERGQAHFQVAHDPQRPFWVVVGGSWVRAVGTAFDVHLRASDVLVTVSEGTVKVGLGDVLDNHAQLKQGLDQVPASVLRAGQQGDVQAKSIEVRSLSADELSGSVAWRSGMIYFEDEPLDEVIDEISRYTTLQLMVDDETLRSLRLGGTFEASARGVESFLTLLKDGFGLRIRREPNHVYIEPGASERWQKVTGDINSIHPSPTSSSPTCHAKNNFQQSLQSRAEPALHRC